jgi:hypothetical protein
MPFNPNLPQEGTAVDAAEMRGQLNALKALIDAQAALIAAQEVRLAALETELPAVADELRSAVSTGVAGCALNPSGVSQMVNTISDPPTQWEVGTMFNTVNALIGAHTRTGS